MQLWPHATDNLIPKSIVHVVCNGNKPNSCARRAFLAQTLELKFILKRKDERSKSHNRRIRRQQLVLGQHTRFIKKALIVGRNSKRPTGKGFCVKEQISRFFSARARVFSLLISCLALSGCSAQTAAVF